MSNDCNRNNGTADSEQTRNNLISKLCDIILVTGDYPDYNSTRKYIEDLNEFETSLLYQSIGENEKISIRSIVNDKLDNYLRKYRRNEKSTSPFEFDSGDAYKEYRSFFGDVLKEKTSQSVLPPIFECVFQCIKESSEHYRLFENFYLIRREDVLDVAQKSAKDIALQTTQDAANQAAKDAAQKAEIQAEIAANTAKKATEDAENAAQNAAKIAVDNEMTRVSRTVSEATVTVLGIFAAIILTVVAGLMYSSSMLDNMNTSNYYRLIAVGALVGFVCFNLVAVMLRFISKYRHASKDEKKEFDKNSGYSKMMFFVSCVLLLIFIVFTILQFYLSDPIYCNHTHCRFK